MKILIICGHGAGDPGACSSLGVERDEVRKIGPRVAELLRGYKDTTVDIYPTNRNAYADVKNGTVAVNFANYDYVFEIHFNSATNVSANGVEIWVTPSEQSVEVEQKIVNYMAALGFTNRGVKKEYFAVITAAKNKGTSAALIETCFIMNQYDMALYKNNFEKICQAMVRGITEGFQLHKFEEVYRIRKSWADSKSQVGAYSKLENAKANCPSGYKVFNSAGECVYDNAPVVVNKEIYRIRKSWADTKSQVGAYSSLDNAKANCPVGYKVFNSAGKCVYDNVPTYKYECVVYYCNQIDVRAALYLGEYLNCLILDAAEIKDPKYFAKNLICVGGDTNATVGAYKTHWVKGSDRYETAQAAIDICRGKAYLSESAIK